MKGKINDYKFKVALKQTVKERYVYFVKRIVAKEELWGLVDKDGNWSLVEDSKRGPIFHLWPDEEFAKYARIGMFDKYSPTKVDLHEFMEDWLPNMAIDGVKVGVFTLSENEPSEVDAAKLLKDIQEEEKIFFAKM
jgi:hypothetical protein